MQEKKLEEVFQAAYRVLDVFEHKCVHGVGPLTAICTDLSANDLRDLHTLQMQTLQITPHAICVHHLVSLNVNHFHGLLPK